MEDFVPSEIAKKLKEKGFEYECFGHYFNNEFYTDMPPKYYQREKYVSAPTISQVLKWLRETHNIFIVVFINDDTNNPVSYEIYEGVECVLCVHRYFSLNDWSKAEIDAIEYVLDNLI